VRLLVMMSLALLPVGLIAITQTRAVSQNTLRNSELALLARVERSALNERLAIQRAMGAANTIAAYATELARDPLACSARLRGIAENSDRFSFMGLLPVDGQVLCSTASQPFELSQDSPARTLMMQRDPVVRVNTRAPISKVSIISVSVPYYDGEAIAGRVSVSLPLEKLRAVDEVRERALLDLVTYNDSGEVLTQVGAAEKLESELPAGLTLHGLTDERARAFTGYSRGGEMRIYTLVPIEANQLFVLGIWDARRGVADQLGDRLPPILFPMLMWLTSLLVVLFAIHRLVTRHIRNLRRQMVRFARDRTLSGDGAKRGDMPAELFEMQSSFDTMAYSIMQDEARLENAVREKNVLIREIHHRVKNNLQLISSILNMQIRDTPSEGTRDILRRVQDRVLSLATIHRDLYQANTAGMVNVGNLLREIVEKGAEISGDEVALTLKIEDVMLYPDQAVPMSLLASEAVTNALKYGQGDSGKQVIDVSLTREGKTCEFRIVNALGNGEPDSPSTGMGTKLINAFAIQLGADLETDRSDDTYSLTVRFDEADFVPQAETY
jgi:two-component sensor histidine kinase